MICEKCARLADGKAVLITMTGNPPPNRHGCPDGGCTCQHREKK